VTIRRAPADRPLATRFGWALLLVLLSNALPVCADYPRIGRLDRSDPLFLQHQYDIQEFYRRSASGSALPPLLIYRYDLSPPDTLFAIAARFSLPYSAIASLNRLTSPSLDGRSSILVPGHPGIFLPAEPRTDLETIMHDLRRDRSSAALTVASGQGQESFRYFAGEDFLPDERTAFLAVIFRHPLPDSRLTSPFGTRVNPITSRTTFHGGADYAAPEGTAVLAARAGRVVDIGFDQVLGTYVVVQHDGGFQTFYGHLRSVHVSLYDRVRSGMMLGAVGSTGMVTGPHLHFEIRQNGQSRDPETMLR
jgi:murein DD-endopeptidase MepM/ murein hydrolase activator NlpD